MKGSLLIIGISALIIFNACGQQAKNPSNPVAVSGPSFKTPRQIGLINDYENLLNPEEKYNLEHWIKEFKTETGIEIVIASFDTTMIAKDKFYDYTLKVANAWGVGDNQKNRGILIGFSKGYRQIRINNSYGIEKLITDAETKKIMDSFFIANFKKDKYYEGVFDGTIELMKLLRTKLNKK